MGNQCLDPNLAITLIERPWMKLAAEGTSYTHFKDKILLLEEREIKMRLCLEKGMPTQIEAL